MEAANTTSTASSAEVVHYLRQAIDSGRHWYLALLEAIGRWTLPQEEYQGHRYCYLIAGEAFDWLTLAQRLCLEADGQVSQDERDRLRLEGQPPLQLSAEKFRSLIGDSKYRAYLNYYYGVLVEQALQRRTEEEVRKESLSRGFRRVHDLERKVYQRIYGELRAELLLRFREQRGLPIEGDLSPTADKEFTYWLFKYRLEHCDRARLASDTKKGLDWLHRLGEAQGAQSGASFPAPTEVIDAVAWPAMNWRLDRPHAPR